MSGVDPRCSRCLECGVSGVRLRWPEWCVCGASAAAQAAPSSLARGDLRRRRYPPTRSVHRQVASTKLALGAAAVAKPLSRKRAPAVGSASRDSWRASSPPPAPTQPSVLLLPRRTRRALAGGGERSLETHAPHLPRRASAPAPDLAAPRAAAHGTDHQLRATTPQLLPSPRRLLPYRRQAVATPASRST
eukprot:scaffold8827_cov69-Phaeocystis_antarctica.AAC.4